MIDDKLMNGLKRNLHKSAGEDDLNGIIYTVRKLRSFATYPIEYGRDADEYGLYVKRNGEWCRVGDGMTMPEFRIWLDGLHKGVTVGMQFAICKAALHLRTLEANANGLGIL